MEALAIAFIQAMVTGAGTAAGARLIEVVFPRYNAAGKAEVLTRLQSNPTHRDEQAAQKQLVAEMKRDPNFIPVVRRTLKTELRRDPELLARVGRWDRLIGDLWGLSDEQIVFKSTSRCPIGGESIWWFCHCEDANGNRVPSIPQTWSDLTDEVKKRNARDTVMVCPRGHRWPLYDNEN